jgi:NADH-quinone oxidoreductase subunit H
MTKVLSSLNFGSAGDPLFAHHIGWAVLGIVALKVLVTFVVLLVATMFMVWFERKVISDMQNRIGPNRAGPFGLLQTLADGTKLFFKEDLFPERADKLVFRLAPYLSVVPAFLSFAIVPIGGIVHMFGHDTRLQLADPPVGILWLLVMSSVSVYGVMLAGWSSGSKYPLLGSVRASAQMVSYEAALGLSVATVVLVTGALETSSVVAHQMRPLAAATSWMPHWIHSWNLLALVFVPFCVFVISATAELNRPPFDLVEAEQELVGGFHTEYSSLRFAMFFLAEFMNTITMSAVIVTLFLGGPDGPTPGVLPNWLWGIVWFLVKLFVFLYIYVWLRGTLPRVRYDQLMDMGWKYLIPLSLGWLLLVAAAEVRVAYAVLTIFGLILCSGILYVAVSISRERREFAEEDDFGSMSSSSSPPEPPSEISGPEGATV